MTFFEKFTPRTPRTRHSWLMILARSYAGCLEGHMGHVSLVCRGEVLIQLSTHIRSSPHSPSPQVGIPSHIIPQLAPCLSPFLTWESSFSKDHIHFPLACDFLFQNSRSSCLCSWFNFNPKCAKIILLATTAVRSGAASSAMISAADALGDASAAALSSGEGAVPLSSTGASEGVAGSGGESWMGGPGGRCWRHHSQLRVMIATPPAAPKPSWRQDMARDWMPSTVRKTLCLLSVERVIRYLYVDQVICMCKGGL